MDDEDSISNIYVKVEKGADAQEVADRIDAKYGDDITTINGKLNNTVQMDVKFADGTTASYDVVVKE